MTKYFYCGDTHVATYKKNSTGKVLTFAITQKEYNRLRFKTLTDDAKLEYSKSYFQDHIANECKIIWGV